MCFHKVMNMKFPNRAAEVLNSNTIILTTIFTFHKLKIVLFSSLVQIKHVVPYLFIHISCLFLNFLLIVSKRMILECKNVI